MEQRLYGAAFEPPLLLPVVVFLNYLSNTNIKLTHANPNLSVFPGKIWLFFSIFCWPRSWPRPSPGISPGISPGVGPGQAQVQIKTCDIKFKILPLTKYYVLLFQFKESPYGHCPPHSAHSAPLLLWLQCGGRAHPHGTTHVQWDGAACVHFKRNIQCQDHFIPSTTRMDEWWRGTNDVFWHAENSRVTVEETHWHFAGGNTDAGCQWF